MFMKNYQILKIVFFLNFKERLLSKFMIYIYIYIEREREIDCIKTNRISVYFKTKYMNLKTKMSIPTVLNKSYKNIEELI